MQNSLRLNQRLIFAAQRYCQLWSTFALSFAPPSQQALFMAEPAHLPVTGIGAAKPLQGKTGLLLDELERKPNLAPF